MLVGLLLRSCENVRGRIEILVVAENKFFPEGRMEILAGAERIFCTDLGRKGLMSPRGV